MRAKSYFGNRRNNGPPDWAPWPFEHAGITGEQRCC